MATSNPLDSALYIGPLVFQKSAGFDEDQSLIVSAWAIGTWALKQFSFYPPLAIYGPYGSGKTTTLKILRQITSRPSELINVSEHTKPALENRLTYSEHGTALLDECDHLRALYTDRDLESLIQARSSKDSSPPAKMERDSRGNYHAAKPKSIFGATAFYRRMPLADAALESRSILVRTRKLPEGRT